MYDLVPSRLHTGIDVEIEANLSRTPRDVNRSHDLLSRQLDLLVDHGGDHPPVAPTRSSAHAVELRSALDY